MEHSPVVVGVDGSDPAYAAVTWAAREADHRRAPLRIVHVLEWRPGKPGDRHGHAYLEPMWAEATRRAHEAAPRVAVRADALLGRPVERLAELARDADLLVVGHRGRGGFAGMRLGSVSDRVARRASCPVAVVRGRAAPDGPVVAGVDGLPAADAVLRGAFEAAAGRGCAVVVLRAAAGADPAEEHVAPWRAKYPLVPVELRHTRAEPGPALAEASAGARLVVVGSRGHDYVRSVLLGSTGLHLLHHAACPVLITRPNGTRDFGL